MEQVLAVRGVGGYGEYRAPALAVSPRGSLFAVYMGLGGQREPDDVLLRRSFDGGASWEPQQVVGAGGAGQASGAPGLLCDASTGRIFLVLAGGDGKNAAAPDPAPTNFGIELATSDDDGATWQHRTVTPRWATGTAVGLLTAGSATRLHTGPYTGRLLVQFSVQSAGRRAAASGYSDDHGETWTIGEPLSVPMAPAAAAHPAGESAAVSLDDGRVLLHLWAEPNRLAAFSDDGGRSYGPVQPVEELPDPGSAGSLIRFDGLPELAGLAGPATRRWLLAANCQDPTLHRNLVLSLSQDNGESWPHKLTIWAGGAADPAAVRLPDGRIGVLYRRQAGRELVYSTADPGLLLSAWPRGAVTPRSNGDGTAPAPETGPLPVVKDYPLRFDMILDEVRRTGEGRARPGYRAGDVLVFAGRARVLGPQQLRVQLDGPFDNAEDFPPQELGPGGEIRFLHPLRTVTANDVEAGCLTVTFSCTAEPVDGASSSTPVARRQREFRIDVLSGEVSEG